jgi:hypothetical protein
MPVVHALLQAREDVGRLAERVPEAHVWQRPGGAASIGFHIRHTGGALDRLFTYARGEPLSEAQLRAMREEGLPGEPPTSLQDLAAEAFERIDRALEQLRATPTDILLTPRLVGRRGLPSTTLGLLFHAAEHATRHIGQAITSGKVVGGKWQVSREVEK